MSLSDKQKLREAEIEYCATDIVYFIETYGHFEQKNDPTKDLIQPFNLWKEQREAAESIQNHRWNIILKARQLGFTWLALHFAAITLLQKGTTVIGLSRTEDEAKELVRRLGVILSYIPELINHKDALSPGWDGAIFNSTALTLTVTHPDGSESVFKAFPSSPGAGRSFTANLIIFDEWAFQQFAREIWQGAFPTINSAFGGKVIGLSTIERGSFFEEMFTDPDNGFNKIFIPWYADPSRDKEWEKRTRNALGDLFTAEYPATVEEALQVPGGAMFPEVKKETHESEEQMTGLVKRYVAIDYGLDMLSAHWITIDIHGRAQVYREYDCPDLIVSKAAKILLSITSTEKVDGWLAPPDLWNRSQETGKSVATIFSEEGIHLIKVSNDLVDGVVHLKEWLQVREDGKPMLTFLKDTCPNAIKCLQKIQKDKLKPNVYAKQPHDLTHDVDSLRYFAVWWTCKPKVAPPKKKKWRQSYIDDYRHASKEIRALMIQEMGEPQL